jgi:hypothetical protein
MALATLDVGARAQKVCSPRIGARVADLLRIALALLVVGNLGRVPVFAVGVKDTPILLNDLLLLAVLSAGVFASLRGRKLVIDGPAAFAMAFVGVGALSALLAIPRFGLTAFEFIYSIAYLVRWTAYFGVYLVVINFVRRDDVGSLWHVLETAILVFAGFGVVQSLFLPGFAQMVFPDQGWDVQGHRLVSTLLDPNFAGALIAIGLLVLLARMSHGVQAALWKPVLLFAALVLTISRSAVLAFLAGVVIILFLRGLSKRLLKIGGLLLVLMLPFVPLILDFAIRFGRFSLEGSAALRVLSWLRALKIFADNPILGIGFNTYGFVQRSYGYSPVFGADFALDGGLLFIAVMTGLIGVSLYSGMLLLVLVRCRRISKDASRSADERGLALGAAAVTVAMVVHSVFLNSLLFPFLMETLWVLWGFTFVLRSHEHLEAEVPSSGQPRRLPLLAAAPRPWQHAQ